MNANYKPRIDIPGVLSRTLTEREYTLVKAVRDAYEDHLRELYATVEDDQTRLMNAALETYLAVLHRRYHFGARVLREIWEDTIRLRAGLRTFLRDIGEDGSTYLVRRHGENVEDTAIRMELADLGVNIKAWEDAVRYDERTGDVWFEDM